MYKFPKPNLTCFHTTSACSTSSLLDVLRVKKFKIASNVNFVAVSVSTHLGDLEDDGLGSLARAGDVDVHVAVDVEVVGHHPLHLLLGLHRWPVALKNLMTLVFIPWTHLAVFTSKGPKHKE